MTHGGQAIAERESLIRCKQVIADVVALTSKDRMEMLADVLTKRISWKDVRDMHNRPTIAVKEHRDNLNTKKDYR